GDGGKADALKEALERHDIDFLRDEYPDAIVQAQAGVDQITSIVGAVKQFSQADQGCHERIDLADVIRNALELSRRTWSLVADVIFDADDRLSPIQGNAPALGQVVINLIVNASDAIAEQSRNDRGKIEVQLHEDDQGIVLRITDDGVGIAPDHLDRVFDLFFTTKPPGEGTGQGLAVAHTIITQEHGGGFSVDSRPGEGTTFSIVLPKALEMAA
ncbi:MAG: sensor histidine kinase, partial [Geminicoccaceae bacterium]